MWMHEDSNLVICFHNDIQQRWTAFIKVIPVWWNSILISINDLTEDLPTSLAHHKLVQDGLG